MKEKYVRVVPDRLRNVDRTALGVGARISLRGEHRRERGPRTPLQARAAEPAPASDLQHGV